MSCAATGHTQCVFPFVYNRKEYTACTMDDWTACWCATIYDFKDVEGTYVTCSPTPQPSAAPTKRPTKIPTMSPSWAPSDNPTKHPSKDTIHPTTTPSFGPTQQPTLKTMNPSAQPSALPSAQPSALPTTASSNKPTAKPTKVPTIKPTKPPTIKQTKTPTNYVITLNPTFSSIFTSSVDPILSTEYDNDIVPNRGANKQTNTVEILNNVLLAMGIVIFCMFGVFIYYGLKYIGKRGAQQRLEAQMAIEAITGANKQEKKKENVNVNEMQMRSFSVNSAPPAAQVAMAPFYNNNVNVNEMQMRSFSVNSVPPAQIAMAPIGSMPFYNNDAMAAPAAVNIGFSGPNNKHLLI